MLISRGLSFPEFKQLYFDTLEQCAELASETEGDDSRGWLEREIRREQDLARAAALQDRVKPFADAEFEEASAGVLRFARARAAFMRCEIGKRTDPLLAKAHSTPPPAGFVVVTPGTRRLRVPVLVAPEERQLRAPRVKMIK